MMRRLDARDIGIAALLSLGAGAYLFAVVDCTAQPAEDAAMLMRYATHVAQGHGIVWNTGEPPVEGATDFLFLILTGLLTAAGASVEVSTRALGSAAHLATVAIVYVGARRALSSSTAAAVSAVFVALGPGHAYVEAAFATPFHALCAAGAWYVAVMFVECRTTRNAWMFGVAALVLGLSRPDGVLLAGAMAAGVVIAQPRDARVLVTRLTAVFVTLGLAYFVWRAQYFHALLPNPFYRKGGGTLHWDSFLLSWRHGIGLLLPFLPAFAIAPATAGGRRALALVGVPVAAFLSVWVLLSDEMNFFARFQYPLLPIVAMSWPLLVRDVCRQEHLEIRATRFTALACATLLPLLVYQHARYQTHSPRDGRYDVAQALAPFADRAYTMATTEAGLLPLYSGWRAVDAWGLNDRRIARDGRLTRRYLADAAPAVIMFHGYFSPVTNRAPTGTAWDDMVATLDGYARDEQYVLAAAYGPSGTETHVYYVRRDLADRDAVVAAIRGVPYAWGGRHVPNMLPDLASR